MKVLRSPWLFAPIAEVTTLPLRACAHSFSPSVTLCSEMLSAKLVLCGGKYNGCLEQKGESEPLIYQLLGNDPVVMRDAVLRLSKNNPEGFDINMGCSAPDILKARMGSWLLKEKEKARLIVRACRAATDLSLSVKLRAGFDAVDPAFTLDFCSMLSDEGIDYVVVHPRAAKHAFRRAADWRVIAHLVSHLPIPVVGNGDIMTAHDALLRRKESGCAGVMIARAAVQMPWLFASCIAAEKNDHSGIMVDRYQVARDVLDGIAAMLPAELHLTRAHRFLFYYAKNFTYGHQLFGAVRQETELEKMALLIQEYCERNIHERYTKL